MKYKAKFLRILKIVKKLILPLTGLAALVWFLVRVIPKPSRAFYPCQRTAFPIAAAFVAWIITTGSSIFLFRRGISYYLKLKLSGAAILIFTSLLIFGSSFLLAPKSLVFSNSLSTELVLLPDMKELVADDASTASYVSTVSIEKSSKARAVDLTYDDIKEMVTKAIKDAGGMDDLISDGDTVVIKPNLVSYKSSGSGTMLPSEVNGITTDWRIIKVISELVRDLNPNGRIFVMEGSAQSTEYMYSQMNYNTTSMPEVDRFFCLESCSGGWRDQSASELKAISLPPEKKLYPDNEKPYNSSEYYLNKLYFNADVIISVPLIKNHESASVTGSIKNLCIGTSPANIYGMSKTNNNRGTINHGTYLHEYLHDFYLCRPADFAIMDGLQGLEYGPVVATTQHSYEESLKNMRLILASRDLLALDAIEALLESYDPAKVRYMVHLHNDDAGCADPTLIKVVGAKVADERQDFKHTQSTSPKFTDTMHPDFTVSSVILQDDDKLIIHLGSHKNIDKIEVAINDEPLDNFYVNNFDSLVIDASAYNIDAATNLQFVAYNKYLAYKELSITDILSANSNIDFTDNYRVYPTAVADKLFIDGNYQNATVCIYNLRGELMMSEDIYTNMTSMDLSHLQTGFYLVNIHGDSPNVYTDKIYKY